MKLRIVKTYQVALLLGDLLILYASLVITLLIRYGHISRDLWLDHVMPFSFVYLIWLVVLYINDFYNTKIPRLELIQRAALAMTINAGITVAFFYLVPILPIAPRTNFVINIFLALTLLFLWRLASGKVFKQDHSRIIFLGEAPESQELHRFFEKRPHLPYTPVATIPRSDLLHFSDKLEAYLEKHAVNMVVVCVDVREYPRLASKLYPLLGSTITVVDVVSFYEELLGRIPLSVLSAAWFLENINEGGKKFYEIIKRGFDIAGSIFCGIPAGLILPIVFLAIKLDDGGKIFYFQNRSGKNKKNFVLCKLRTMREGAETSGPQFARINDTRVTRVGAFLRKTRIDELPQLWNVLCGDMSFVGPRPERAEFIRELETQFPFYTIRHLIKPGLTGWAQVYYNYAASLEENLKKLQYDFFYIKNRSLLLDFMILLKTLNIILRFRGR